MTEVIEAQTFLTLPDQRAIDRLNGAGGMVHVADLEWPPLGPGDVVKFDEYVARLGSIISAMPRETSVVDSPLSLYRNDFDQAGVPNLESRLFVPYAGPIKSVVKIREWRDGLERNDYPGTEPFSTGVAVSEDVYEEIVRHAAYFANQAYNYTERKKAGRYSVEQVADLAGESVVYGLTDKHEGMEARHRYISERISALNALHKVVSEGKKDDTLNLETLRLDALGTILGVARVACRRLGYGENQTRDTLRAVASNTHRSPNLSDWWIAYTEMAVRYNNEVLGKLEHSIQSVVEQIGEHRVHVFNNLDREYEDDDE